MATAKKATKKATVRTMRRGDTPPKVVGTGGGGGGEYIPGYYIPDPVPPLKDKIPNRGGNQLNTPPKPVKKATKKKAK